MRKIEIEENDFLLNYQRGLNDVELSKIYNTSSEKIRKYRISLGLDSNFKYSKCISKNELREYVEKGLSDYEISDETGINHSWIFQLRRKYNLDRPNKKYNQSKILTKRQEEILIGHVLGDGFLCNKYTNCSGKIEQGESQKDYAEWKYNEFKNLCSPLKKYIRKTIDSRTNLFYVSYNTRILSNPELNKYYDLFYQNKKKYISLEIMDLFTPLSLAVLFMDDGSKTANSYTIATNCYNRDDLELLKSKLMTWDIHTSIQKDNILYILSKSKNQFENLIKEYIIDSMLYKLH